ncbi:TPA: MFS transporter, partial [Enterococcus faecium]|nr:MFS transporter [Enterococcus faecium]HEN2078160.1 MFS transporter [Enterococcus faecium]
MERKFGIRDKIGYMFGDFGNDFTFIFASSFLMIFYTKVLGISGAAVGTLFLVARFIDAVTDVTMGRIVDRSKATKQGKFKPWILRMSGPVALASFLMYQTSMISASMSVKVVYMYVTYILWGSIFYTSINIPYGSMASAITSITEERTMLSTFRNVGATLASLVIGVLTPLFIYTRDDSGAQIVRGGSTFTIVAGIFSICALICYLICYKLTTERVRIDQSQYKVSLLKSLKGLVKNRALLSIIGAAIFLLLAQLLIMSMNNYVFPDYYNDAQGIVLMNFINPILVLIVV